MGFFNRKKSVIHSSSQNDQPHQPNVSADFNIQELNPPKGDMLFDIKDQDLSIPEHHGAWLVVYDRASKKYCDNLRTFIDGSIIHSSALAPLSLGIANLTAASRMRVCLYEPRRKRTFFLKYSGQSAASQGPAFLLPTPDPDHPDAECRCLYTSSGGLLSVAYAGNYLKPDNRPDVFITPEAIDLSEGLVVSSPYLSDTTRRYTYYGIYDADEKRIFPFRLDNGHISINILKNNLPSQSFSFDSSFYLCLISTEPEAKCYFLKIGRSLTTADGSVFEPIPLDSLYDSLVSRPLQLDDGSFIAFCLAADGRIRIAQISTSDLEKYHDPLTVQEVEAKISSPVFKRFDPETSDIDADGFFKYAADSIGALKEEPASVAEHFQLKKRIISNLLKMIDKATTNHGSYESYSAAYDTEWHQLQDLLQLTEDDIIIEAVTARYMKMFLLSCKYARPLDRDEYLNDIMLRYGDTELFTMSSLFLRLDILKIEDQVLTIEGYLRIPEALADEGLMPTVYVNEKAIPVKTTARYTDRYVFEKLISKDIGFILEIPLNNNLKTFAIRFGVKSQGFVSLCRQIEFNASSPVTNKAKGAYYYQNGFVLQSTAGRILCTRISDEQELVSFEDIFREQIKADCGDHADDIIALREYYWANKDSDADDKWIMLDRTDRADDNAEVLFRYVVQKQFDHVKPIFILSQSSPQFEELSEIGTVLDFRSEEHLKAVLTCKYIFSSQFAPSTMNPFNDDFDYFRDIVRSKKFVFLQHGVTKDDNGNSFSHYARNFYGIVVSGNEEYDYLCSPILANDPKSIWLTGMPRFDRVYNNDQKIITIMPTWRKYLTDRVFDEEQQTYIWRVKDSYKQSEYYNFYNSLINDERLINAAREKSYTIQLMPHVLFLKQADDFEIKYPDIVSLCNYDTSYCDVFSKSSLILTDFSSIGFDFGYLHKPVVYCQFDKKAFYKNHTMKPGYFDYEPNGFGEVLYDLPTTIDTLISYIQNDCQMKALYRDRVDNFFRYTDHSCCERICSTIFELEKKGSESQQDV